MKTRIFTILLVFVGLSLLSSCSSRHFGSAHGSEDGVFSQGLGKLGSFAGQEQGEVYTSRAPHNQIYLFSYDSSSLASKYTQAVNAQAQYLISHPGAKVLLAGHTDERGSREYNVALGERRANTVANLLRIAGVNRTQIRVVSYGKERPVYFGHDEASHKQNRRVELIYEATR